MHLKYREFALDVGADGRTPLRAGKVPHNEGIVTANRPDHYGRCLRVCHIGVATEALVDERTGFLLDCS